MKRVSAFGVGLVAVLVLAGGSHRAQAQDEAKTIVGVWEVAKSSDLPPGSTIEFAKDGKVKVLVKEKGEPINLEGTYKVEQTRLTVKLKLGDQTIDETVTIKKLTATDLHLEDKEKKVDEFKRK
jgi:uncharacterized protein (TIGR03066 family)